VTDDDTEQRSITDYPSTGSQSSDSGPSQSESRAPSASDLDDLYSRLQSDTASPEQIVDELPELIEQAQKEGHEAWKASECINIILTATSPPIDCPELVNVLDNEHLDTVAVITHLLEIYPRDVTRIETSIDLDILESDELSPSERMEGYRALSRLPPDEVIYGELQRTAEMFDGALTLNETYPVGGFFRTYAMRCLETYLRYPQQAPQDCAYQAVTDHPWAATRVVANNINKAKAELLAHLTGVLEGKTASKNFYHGQIVFTICEEYTRNISPNIEQELRSLIQVLLDAGIYPTRWETIISQLIDWLEHEDRSKNNGLVFAAILRAVQNQAIDEKLIDEIVENLTTGNPAPWVDSTLLIAETNPAELIKHLEKLVTTARTSNGAVRTKTCEALAALGKTNSSAVLEAVEPLVEDLEQVKSVQELVEVGSILEASGAYPPPSQLQGLYGSADEQIDETAKKIVRNLRQQFEKENPCLVPGEIDALQSLSEEYSLVRQAGAVTWESPSLDTSKLSLITAIAQLTTAAKTEDPSESEALRDILKGLLDVPPEVFVEGDELIQFVVPSYDSKWIEYAVLGTAFAQLVNPDIRVVLHTPALGGWGTKKDVKEALQQYGIAPSDNMCSVVPLLDLVPTARLTDGDVTVETKRTTVTDEPPYLTLTRDIDPLAQAQADVILYNYLPGIDATNAGQLQQWRRTLANNSVSGSTEDSTALSADGYGEIADKASLTNLVETDEVDPQDFTAGHSDDPTHIEIYSIFTSQHAADRRQHVGPPTDLPVPSLITQDNEREDTSSTTGDRSPEEIHSKVPALTDVQSLVELHAIQSDDEIGELLSKIEDYCDQISDSDISRALRSFKYTIGSLPVPVDLHDTWVQNQIDQGNKWVPRRIHRRRNKIQGLTDKAGFDTELLDEAVVTIDTLLKRLDETNPVSEELLTVLDDAAAESKRVGVLCAKKTYKDMLDAFLTDQASEWVLGDDLLLLDEDSIRELEPDDVDWIISFGPLPPQTAIYYHHPAVEKTIVLGHADGSLEARIHGVEYKRRPFLPHRVDTELPGLEVTTHGKTLDVSDDDTSLTDNLYRTFLSVAAQSHTDDGSQSGSSGQMSRYQIELSGGDEKVMWDVHPMIVRSEEHLVSAGDYVLRSLSRISSGDEIVLIDPDARNELWEEFLRQDWEETDETEAAEEAFMDAVELWHEAVSTGLAAHSNTSDLGDGILGFAREIEPEISVETETVEDWARGVYRAEAPSDLVFRSDLRIGPRHADGVEAVAEAYGSDRMAENWEQVFTRMKAIRATHRQRGSVFWEWLADRACDGSLFDYPGVSRVTITRCENLES